MPARIDPGPLCDRINVLATNGPVRLFTTVGTFDGLGHANPGSGVVTLRRYEVAGASLNLGGTSNRTTEKYTPTDDSPLYLDASAVVAVTSLDGPRTIPS